MFQVKLPSFLYPQQQHDVYINKQSVWTRRYYTYLHPCYSITAFDFARLRPSSAILLVLRHHGAGQYSSQHLSGRFRSQSVSRNILILLSTSKQFAGLRATIVLLLGTPTFYHIGTSTVDFLQSISLSRKVNTTRPTATLPPRRVQSCDRTRR